MSNQEIEKDYVFFENVKNAVLSMNSDEIAMTYITFLNEKFGLDNSFLKKRDYSRSQIKIIYMLFHNKGYYKIKQAEVLECLIIVARKVIPTEKLIPIYILLFYLFPNDEILKRKFCNYIINICDDSNKELIINEWNELEYLEQALIITPENKSLQNIMIIKLHCALKNLVNRNVNITNTLKYRLESDVNFEIKKALDNLFKYTSDLRESLGQPLMSKSKITLPSNYKTCLNLINRCIIIVKKYRVDSLNQFVTFKNEFELKLGYRYYSKLIEEEKIINVEDLINFKILKTLEKI